MAVRVADQPNELARRLFAGLPERYDRLAEVLSFGQNRRWRQTMVDRLAAGLHHSDAPATPRVLDVASGTAGVALAVSSQLGADVVGADLSLDMLGRGAANVGAHRQDGPTVVLVAGRAEALPFPDAAFDGLTFTYLLRYVADVDATMAELARVVKPGGPVASLDFGVPASPVWRGCWWAYTRMGLPLAGLATGGAPWGRVGTFLGPNISSHYRRHPVPDLVGAWERAGLQGVRTQPMSLGGGLVMWGRRDGG